MEHKAPSTWPTSIPRATPHVLHSHRQAGEGAIAEEQISRGEGGDAKLFHELLLTAQHPPHRNILILQHVQGHLQAPDGVRWVWRGIPQPHQGGSRAVQCPV